MKKLLIAICCGAALYFVSCSGCKEVPPTINFGSANYKDTVYTVEAPSTTDLHNVLVEEFTGQSCSNCPAGHATLDAAASANPGRVNVISMYESDGSSVTNPPNDAVYDFRDSAALKIGNSSIYNSVPSLPNAGIDRVPIAGSTGNLIGAANWGGSGGAISNRLPVADSLNMTVASTYNGAVATMTVTLTYTKAVSTPQNLSVVVVEDSIIDYQEFPFGVDSAGYVYNDVFVGMVSTVPYGDPVLSTLASKAPGQFVQRVYTYTLPGSFAKGLVSPAHCRVIAFVNAPGTGDNGYQVYQSAQCKLMGP